MPIEIRVPEVGESISQVEIGEWLKKEGDFVERDDDVVVIETDKATVEVPAPESGTITRILKPSGQTASVHEVIAYIDVDKTEEAGQSRTAPTRKEASADIPSASAPSARDDDRKLSAVARPSHSATLMEQTGDQLRATQEKIPNQAPEVAEAIAEAGAETLPEPELLTQASDTEPEDVPERSQSVPESNRTGSIAGRPQAVAMTAREEKPQQLDKRTEQIVAMSHLRRRIAERLVQAQRSAALLTTFNEVDMSSVIDLRKRYRDPFDEQYQTKLGFMSFFVKAAVEALRLVPEVNAEIRGSNIVYRNFFDIGIAVGGGKGLVVPVLRNAEHLSFAEIERAIADFARRAEENKLSPEELQGGTFTISNGGIYGSLLSTPIVNPPQSGILGLHAIQERPVARNGAVVVRPMMYTALSYDHRLIDGREAVKFLRHVKDLIEDPARILLGI